MRGFILATLLALTPLCQAQRLSNGRESLTVLEAPAPANCPVGIEAHRQPSAPRLLVESPASAAHPVYNIQLRSFNARLIREAAVELIGPTSAGVVNVGQGRGTGDATESFTLAKASSSVISTARLTAVRWVDLVSVTYVDGSSWHRTAEKACRVQPSSFLLVK